VQETRSDPIKSLREEDRDVVGRAVTDGKIDQQGALLAGRPTVSEHLRDPFVADDVGQAVGAQQQGVAVEQFDADLSGHGPELVERKQAGQALAAKQRVGRFDGRPT
jgi:hypothetical protein